MYEKGGVAQRRWGELGTKFGTSPFTHASDFIRVRQAFSFSVHGCHGPSGRTTPSVKHRRQPDDEATDRRDVQHRL
jgi:hypothetical protein